MIHHGRRLLLLLIRVRFFFDKRRFRTSVPVQVLGTVYGRFHV